MNPSSTDLGGSRCQSEQKSISKSKNSYQKKLYVLVRQIVFVQKKNGKTRIYCDYRKLNRLIVRDRFPLPLIDDVLDRMCDVTVFTILDLRNAASNILLLSHLTDNMSFMKCPFG